MKRIPVKSSNIGKIGYNIELKTLEVEFKSGSIYQYFDVPVTVYKQLINAPSVGKYFNRYIAHRFRYEMLESDTASAYTSSVEQKTNPKPQTDIKQLYRKLALRFHPDHVAGFEGLMKEVNNLYDQRNYHGLQTIALKYNLA